MKTFNKYIWGILGGIALTASMSACQDDVDAPALDAPKASIEANMSILDLKTEFWSDDNNYADSIYDANDPERRFIIKGTVISSDKEGNIFKSLVIDDGTAALAFSIDSYNLYLNYRRGQEIVLDVTGMTIGKYAGLQQMGHKSWYTNGKTWQVSFMAYEMFAAKAQLNGYPDLAKVDTLTVNTFSDIPNDPAGLRQYQSRLVRFKNVYFADGGQENFSAYHTSVNEEQNRTIVDREGNTRIVRTSGYATWCERRLPVGNIDLVGILGYYNDAWQILMLDYEGVIPVGDVPGAKDNPYEVPAAIADINNGIPANGWVRGYIVGAVAPEVETVSGNSDIEWGAPTVLTSTLVIAPDPDCKTIGECLVVALPAESTFREVANLRDNPANLGKLLLVKGDLVTFMGTPGITGNSGKTDSFEIEGLEIGGSEVPAGDGTEATPYNVAQIIAKGDAVNETDKWVKGYIVGSIPSGTSTTLPYTIFGTDGAVASNLVLAPTADCTDYSKCIPVQLSSGSAVRKALNLVDNPSVLGKLVAIKGNVIKYCGAPGVKEPSEYTIEGSGTTTPTEPSGNPAGTGTAADPYNVAKALAVTNAMAAGVESDEVYVAGVIASIKEVSTSYGNATYYICDEGGTETIGVYRGKWLAGEKFTAEDQIKVGAKVVVKGKLVNYMGNTPQLAQNNELVSYDGQTAGGDQPSQPTGGDGTEASPYNVATALAVTNVLAADVESAEVYVAGTIASIKELSTSFGNATYYLVDEGGTTQFCIYRGYWLGGEKFTAEDQLKVGAKVVVKGKLINYKGNTPEMAQGSQVVSYDGQTAGGGNEEPGGGDEPSTPGDTDGDGTEAAPFSVAQVIAKGDAVNESGQWVRGYIVGSIPSGGSVTMPYTKFSADGAAPSNLVLAPTADCTDYTKCIPVQLVSGSDVRKALNLLDNPANLGKAVLIKGDLLKYCGAPGIKAPSAYKFE